MNTFFTPTGHQSVGLNAYDALVSRAVMVGETKNVGDTVNGLILFVVAQFNGEFTDSQVRQAMDAEIVLTDVESLKAIPPSVLPVAVVKAITKQDLKIRLTKMPAWSKFMAIYGPAIIRVK